MLTRSATQQQLREESNIEDTTSDSKTATSSSPSLDTLICCQDLMEEAAAATAAPLRRRLERMLTKTCKNRDKLGRQRDEESPSTSDLETLRETQSNLEQTRTDYETFSLELFGVETNPTATEDDEGRADEFDRAMMIALRDCKYLISQRSISSNMSSLEAAIRGVTAAYEASPENDHTMAISSLSSKMKELEKDLHLSMMDEDAELRGKSNLILERAYATQGRIAGTKASDIKFKSSKSHVKLKHIEIPSFSGKTEDWLAFKRLFYKAVHENEELDDNTRLTYLVQAMLDLRVKGEMAERLDEPGAYRKILSEMEAEHDKPRWMHRRYCSQMKSLQTNPHTREGMKELISKVNVILNGFIRLKGEDCRIILTSIVEEVMDSRLRALWNQRTDHKKTTPPIEELLKFIKDQSDQMEDNTTPKPEDRVKGRQMQRSVKCKGASNAKEQGKHPQCCQPCTCSTYTAKRE